MPHPVLNLVAGPDRLAVRIPLGYFDQSHFIRDFTAQIGMPPSAYERACAAITQHFV